MSAGFDAYHKWLGILPKDQPPHHYRLLGLEAFESDPDVIETAADRQLTSLRRYQSGEHAAEASKLLNEVSQARLCLLKPESKQKYDAQLRQKLDPTAAFQIETKPEPAGKSAILSRKAAPKTAGAAAGPTPLWKQPAVIGGAVAACVLLIAAVAMFSPSSKDKATPRATVDNDSESDALTKASEKVAKKSSKTSKPADEKPKKALSPTAPAELAAGPAVN
ncbi:MAG TPA: hypothetical protein VHB77_12295, partial [Planctomycetaceae bacterium]|nr:hypothetical protein [Planctomycetaceae bacterium]